MSATTHDFGDGAGAVPAHRHLNPDGDLGGWVGDAYYRVTDQTDRSRIYYRLITRRGQ